jgi:hypothetical protein
MDLAAPWIKTASATATVPSWSRLPPARESRRKNVLTNASHLPQRQTTPLSAPRIRVTAGYRPR